MTVVVISRYVKFYLVHVALSDAIQAMERPNELLADVELYVKKAWKAGR